MSEVSDRARARLSGSAPPVDRAGRRGEGLSHRQGRVPGAARHRPDDRRRRDGRDRRPVGQRQVDDHEHDHRASTGPTAGTVTVDGERIDEMSEEELAVWRGRRVGVVFQFFQLLPTLTALENAMLPLDFARRGSKRERRERALHNLELVGLGDMARPAAVGDVRRPAAARGDRARAGVVPDAGDRRRADRQPGHARPRRRCSSCCGASATRARRCSM